MSQFAKEGLLRGATGEQARRSIEREIETQASGEPIGLDFQNVRAVTVPFADRCIAGLLSGRLTGYYEDRPIFALNANEDVNETIDAALARRSLVLLSLDGGGTRLLGGDDILNATLAATRGLEQPFSVNALAERLGLTPQAANNRVKQLVRNGVLSRRRAIPARGGKEFLYSVPQRT